MDQEQINKEIFDRLDKIEGLVFKPVKHEKQDSLAILPKIEFSLHQRAFFKKYAKDLPGHNRFALVVAFLANGEIGKNISAEDITGCWGKNYTFLGGKKIVPGTYGTRAKESNWLNSRKYGFYELTSSWQSIFAKQYGHTTKH